MRIFNPLLLCDYEEFVCWDKQLVALQSGAIKPVQKKRAQKDDTIK